MARHAARFKVSAQLLIGVMDMPEGTLIYDIQRDDSRFDVFEFVVEHPDLPEVPEGGRPVEVEPVLTHVRWDWNLPAVDQEPTD